MKQIQIIEIANISLRSFQYYEKGERVPDVHIAQRIAKALNVDVSEIFPESC